MLDAPAFNDTATSVAAAKSMKRSAFIMRQQIVAYLAGQPDGATCDQIEEALGFKHQTASARLWEMHFQTFEAWKGDATRKTRSGRLAYIYTTPTPEQRRILAARAVVAA